MVNGLIQMLAADPAQVERVLRRSHGMLLMLRGRVRQLELYMENLRRILDRDSAWIPWPPLPGPVRPITLHEAMVEVVEANRFKAMRSDQIAREIARRGLYRRKDGLPPSVNNVCARASTYPGLFVRDGALIVLRSAIASHLGAE